MSLKDMSQHQNVKKETEAYRNCMFSNPEDNECVHYTDLEGFENVIYDNVRRIGKIEPYYNGDEIYTTGIFYPHHTYYPSFGKYENLDIKISKIDEYNENEFNKLPKDHKIKFCGFEYFEPDYYIINKDLAPRIFGYNSRMDNWKTVEGDYSRDVFRHYTYSVTFAMVTESDSVKEFLFCLLYTSPSPRDQRGSRMPSSA